MAVKLHDGFAADFQGNFAATALHMNRFHHLFPCWLMMPRKATKG
jgi:hypothetical protein